MSTRVLIVYYSRHGSTRALAEAIADGVESIDNCEAILRSVPEVAADTQTATTAVPDSGAPYASYDELGSCDGLLLGSPTRFGNMAAPLKHFLDGASGLWLSGTLVDKPAGVFCSTGSLHGGQEATLLSMQIPLQHLGMIVTGVPYTIAELNSTRTGGTPYGATHFAESQSHSSLSADEKAIAKAQGARVATLSNRLKTQS